jgi:RHS repeat-associated protein
MREQYTAAGAALPTYDSDGNLTNDGTYTYCCDVESRLTIILSAGTCASPTTITASYAYDSQRRRKSKTVGGTTTVYVTDAENHEVLEYNGTSGAVNGWYAYGNGPNDVLNRMNVTASSRQTLIPDIQGSIVASLDAASGALTKTGYQPFGESPSLSSGSFQYAGSRFDPESGLYSMRSRMYRTDWGRLPQPDTIGYAGGNNNLYAYVQNDPQNRTDPFGLCDDPQGCGASANTAVLGPETGLGSNIAASANTNANQLQSANLEAAARVSTAASNTSGVSDVENLTASGGEIQLAQATFGHGAGHVPIEIAPGLERAISGALPPSLSPGDFWQGRYFLRRDRIPVQLLRYRHWCARWNVLSVAMRTTRDVPITIQR